MTTTQPKNAPGNSSTATPLSYGGTKSFSPGSSDCSKGRLSWRPSFTKKKPPRRPTVSAVPSVGAVSFGQKKNPAGMNRGRAPCSPPRRVGGSSLRDLLGLLGFAVERRMSIRQLSLAPRVPRLANSAQNAPCLRADKPDGRNGNERYGENFEDYPSQWLSPFWDRSTEKPAGVNRRASIDMGTDQAGGLPGLTCSSAKRAIRARSLTSASRSEKSIACS
jgi:hypothetical protein